MGKQSAPAAPDPNALIAAQTASNLAATNQNRYDATNPGGTSAWTTDANGNKVAVTTTLDPTQQALLDAQSAGHATAGTLAAALANSQGSSIGAGVGAAPTPVSTVQATNTNPNTAYGQFASTGVLPSGSNAFGTTVANTTPVGTTDAGGTQGSGVPSSGSGGQTVVDTQGNPVYGTSYGNGDNSAYVSAMGVKPAVSGQDLFAWQSMHPDGSPMPAGWTLEGTLGTGTGSTGSGGNLAYQAGTLGQTVGAAPTLGTVGAATPMTQLTGAIPQGQTVSQAQALAQMQMAAPIASYGSGGGIAGYSGPASLSMGTTATPKALQQFTGSAPTPQMIANGGSVAGAGQGIQSTLDLANLGAMPTASEATLKQVQDALYARQSGYLDPQYQSEQAALTARLANQGIGLGSRAYEVAQAQEAAAREKAYAGARNDAITGAGVEQQRLFNMQMAARQQGYTEDLGTGTFQNAAQAQGYGQQLANQQNVIQGTQANNNANNAQLAAQMAIMQQNNAAKQTDFTNQFNITGQNNAAQQANGQYMLGAGQIDANVGIANAQNQLGAGQLNANIAQNNFANTLATNQFNNSAINQNLQNQLATTGFNNAVGQQGFTNQLAQGTFNNNATQQDYTNQLAQGNFNNTALNQGYQNTLSGTQFNNAVQQQGIANQFSQQQANTQAAQVAAQMAQAKATAAAGAGQAAATRAAAANTLAQQNSQYQQSFNASQNQQAFTNYMNTLGYNTSATHTGNADALAAYQTGIYANNSNVNNYLNLNSGSGVTYQPPAVGGGNYSTQPVNASGLIQGTYQDQVNAINAANTSSNQLLGMAGSALGSPLGQKVVNPLLSVFGLG